MDELTRWQCIAFAGLVAAAFMTVLFVFAKLHAEAAERREKSAIDMAREERALRQEAEKRESEDLIASSRRERELARAFFGVGTPERRLDTRNADLVAKYLRGERIIPPREAGEA